MSPSRYRIVVDGELGPRYASAFDGMTVRAHDGETDMTGPIVDQAHLQGLLDRIAGLGLAVAQPHPARRPRTPSRRAAIHTISREHRPRSPRNVEGTVKHDFSLDPGSASCTSRAGSSSGSRRSAKVTTGCSGSASSSRSYGSSVRCISPTDRAAARLAERPRRPPSAAMTLGGLMTHNHTQDRRNGPTTSASADPRDAPAPHLSTAERVARGKAARAEIPRSSHAHVRARAGAR